MSEGGGGGYGNPEDKSKEFEFKPLRIKFNPIVTIVSIILIWSFILTCILWEDSGEEFNEWKVWVTRKWTWLYIGSQDVWAVFMIFLYFSKYGDLKLGKDDEEPEYTTVTWFTMLFACGIGVGLFFFGVAEPVWHYAFTNRYSANAYMPDNLVAQHAMNITFYHWGIHGWIVYAILGCLLALISYREGLPMTMKSCFYPLLGDKIFSWIGDLIDITSIITTLFGVCTSLGFGVVQLNTGLNLLIPDIPRSQLAQIIIIWCITAVATASTVSGVGMGIRRLSEVCFLVGMVLMMMVLMLDNTWYILNLYVQSIGFYISSIIQLGFHCDAFELAVPSFGGADRGRVQTVEGGNSSDGPVLWMDSWTIFYWGWWISWSPFVGMFIARISRGRTIREFINGTMTAPIIYTLFWMTIFGGAGIKSERVAASEGYCCDQNWEIPMQSEFGGYENSVISSATWQIFCDDNGCNTCALNTLMRYEEREFTYMEFYKNLKKTMKDGADGTVGDWETIQFYKGSAAIYEDGMKAVRLSCLSEEEMWFYLMDAYYDVGQFLSVFSMIGIVLYFVTSSDSGSLVIDILASNGDTNPPIVQRVFWALTEGAAATALLVAGGDDALGAVQTVSVCSGLPFTLVLCWACVALWRCCQVTSGDLDPDAPTWQESYFEFCTTLKGGPIVGWMKNVILGPVTAARTGVVVWGQGKVLMMFYIVFQYMMIFLWLLFYLPHFVYLMIDWAFDKEIYHISGLWAFGWLAYLVFITFITSVRVTVRGQKDYLGNPFEDFFATLFCYPSVCRQLELELNTGELTGPAESAKVEAFD